MSRMRVIMFSLAGAAVAALALAGAANRMYFAPRAPLLEQLESATANVQRFQQSLESRPTVMRELEDVVNRTLGGDVESVDHRLRTRLNRIVEQLQFTSATVSTGRPTARQNPAASVFPRSQRELRQEIDFVELDASISAEGTFEQVIALVDHIDAEPWIKRLHKLRIDPKANGERFAVQVRLSTLFLPGRNPERAPRHQYDEQRLDRYAALMSRNPFQLPPPPPRQAAPAPKRPAPDQWLVTGVAAGPDGIEAWVRNGRTGESRRLRVGETIGGAVFVTGNGRHAEFEVDQQRLVVHVGEPVIGR